MASGKNNTASISWCRHQKISTYLVIVFLYKNPNNGTVVYKFSVLTKHNGVGTRTKYSCVLLNKNIHVKIQSSRVGCKQMKQLNKRETFNALLCHTCSFCTE